MIVSCQSLIEDPTLDKLGTSWRWRNVIYTNVAPIYRWMHGISPRCHWGYQCWTTITLYFLPSSHKIYKYINTTSSLVIDYELGTYMKVFEWFIDPNGIKNKHILKDPYPISIKQYVKSSMSIPDWYQKRWYQSNVDPKFTLAGYKHASTQQSSPILDTYSWLWAGNFYEGFWMVNRPEWLYPQAPAPYCYKPTICKILIIQTPSGINKKVIPDQQWFIHSSAPVINIHQSNKLTCSWLRTGNFSMSRW
jgi:hypothetical protein